MAQRVVSHESFRTGKPIRAAMRIAAVICMTAAAACAALAESPDEAAQDSAKRADFLLTDAIFARDSFWYTPIPADAPVHPNSEAFVADFLRQKKAYYGNVNINMRSYASPVYIAPADAPVMRVNEWDCQRKGFRDRRLAEQWDSVPMIPDAEPADGTDAEMTIYQPATNTLWEFWRLRKDDDGQWSACWGGRMSGVSRNPGTWPEYYGTTATGLPFIGGQITAEELQRGEIRHVMGIALVDTEGGGILSWPARRSDGYNPKKLPNRIPEGTRFRLDPAVDVEALKMHPVGKIIARAAQKYGFVVWDKAGAISLRAQNPKSYLSMGKENPYPALFGQTPTYAILKGFPWDKLQFLQKDYGKPSRTGGKK